MLVLYTALRDEQAIEAEGVEQLLEEDEITKDLIFSGLKKIIRIYELSKEGKVRTLLW